MIYPLYSKILTTKITI